MKKTDFCDGIVEDVVKAQAYIPSWKKIRDLTFEKIHRLEEEEQTRTTAVSEDGPKSKG